MSSRVRFSQDGPGITYVPSSHTNQSTNLLSDLLSKPMPRKPSNNEYNMDLFTAASLGDVELLKFLLQVNPEVLSSRNSSGWTPFLYSAYLGHHSVCAFLLNSGARIGESNNRQQTALMMAAACGNVKVVELLLKHGANLSQMDIDKRTALHYAASCGQDFVAKMLLQVGANPNAQDLAGLTPLHEAAIIGHEKTFLSILERGGSLSLKNNKDEDCAALACDNPKIIQLINDAQSHGSPSNLAQLLEEMDLSRYTEQFKNESIDLKIFFELKKEDLDDMKIAYGPKKRMLDVIEKYRKTGVIQTDIFEEEETSGAKNEGRMTNTLKGIKEVNENAKKYAIEALEALGTGQTEKLRQLLTNVIDSVEQIAFKISSHA